MFLTICKLRRAKKARKKNIHTKRQELRFNFPSWFGLQLNIMPFFLLFVFSRLFSIFLLFKRTIHFVSFICFVFFCFHSFVRSCTICNWMLCRISIIHSFSAIFSVCVRIVKMWNGVYFRCILLQILHIFFV